MALSSDLISQFAKITKDNGDTKKESTVYGTAVVYNGTTYVQIDGSDRLTPVSTTTDAKDGERVTVMIKNHTATITGNISSPATRTDDTKKIASNITELEIATAYRITTEDLNAVTAYIDNLKTIIGRFENVSTEDLAAINAEIESIESKFIDTDTITAKDVRIINASIENIQGKLATFTNVSTEDLEAANAEIGQLKAHNAKFTYVFADEIDAITADIKRLNADKVSVDDAHLKYANIDFSNIGKAAMEYFYANSGLIEGVIVGDGTITGNLVGVTIRGDLIEANTLVAEKLVIKGEDGLYYKLNTSAGEQVYYGTTTDGERVYYVSIESDKHHKVERICYLVNRTYDAVNDVNTFTLTDEIVSYREGEYTEYTTTTGEEVYHVFDGTDLFYCMSNTYTITNEIVDIASGDVVDGVYAMGEQTEYNSLDGKNILAKSITATQIAVSDLVAFNATIGGFEIEDDSIHSFGKDSINNTTKGIYLDKNGQLSFGDGNNFIKYHMTEITVYYAVEVSFTEDDTEHTNPIFTATDEVLELDEDQISKSQLTEFVTITGEKVHCLDDKTTFFYVANDHQYKLEISADSILFGDNKKSSISDIKALTEHVKIGKWTDPESGETNPSIELAEGDSDFKQVITNKASMIKDGENVVTEMNSEGVESENVTVRSEIRHGGWAWVTHANGNLGLMWKGANS